MKEHVKGLIRKLGGTIGKKPISVKQLLSTSFYASQRDESWEGKDPLGQLTTVSETIRSYEAVRWPPGKLFLDDPDREKWTAVDMGGASENYEVVRDGVRLVLLVIAYDDLQYYYALNLLDRSADPAVYKFDHGEPEEAYPRFAKLSLFLGSLRTKRAKSASKRLTEWVALIDAASEAGNHRKAIALSEKAIAQHPCEASLLANLGLYHGETGDRANEEAAYRRALEIEPDHIYTLNNYGLLLAHKRQPDRAEELLKRAIAVDASLAAAYYNLACTYALSGQKAKMLEALEHTIALDPSTRKEILGDEDFASFKDDPDFVALSRRQ